ncbi:Adenylate/guanylate cyclase sensor protein [Nitrosotalea devaniterrae]|uniref:histidine kinase n=1 Tax=Nitrosotalea devaniterrae TaxID=1078905 RepID=A0A128A3B3_9ARCH|nr:Adenylate/guanylate cyclase sensor protein [Candidatus Nitrosotalea devanaterra]
MLFNLRFFSLKKKLLVLVLTVSLISIMTTTILFLNFNNIPLFQLKQNIIGIGLALMIAISLITVFLSKRLSEPLTRLREAADKIAKGNFDVRTDIKAHDEIGQLSASFDSMAQKLQESMIAINLREEIIKEQEDILLRFSQKNEDSCVCIIDIVQSTLLTASLSNEQIKNFYGIFINSIAEIVKKFNGMVVKNIGDSLLFYFIKTDSDDNAYFKNVIECCLTISDSNSELNKKMTKVGLPEISYRTSVSYGTISIAKVATSSVDDIFGVTVNRCSKINRFALPNGVIIGSDFYEKVKNFDDYQFRNMNATVGDQSIYSVFLVTRK